MALQVGSRIAHYDVTALIGEGGMGQVYQATDTKLVSTASNSYINANVTMTLRQLLPLLALSLILLPSVSWSQETEELEAATSGAMEALDAFMLAFNARDPEAWAATLNYPHVRFASGSVTVWKSAEEFAENARTRAFVALPRSGWDHSHWLSREVVLVSPDKVHVNTVFQRFNSENEPIGTYQSLYIVTLANDHWGTQARSSLAP